MPAAGRVIHILPKKSRHAARSAPRCGATGATVATPLTWPSGSRMSDCTPASSPRAKTGPPESPLTAAGELWTRIAGRTRVRQSFDADHGTGRRTRPTRCSGARAWPPKPWVVSLSPGPGIWRARPGRSAAGEGPASSATARSVPSMARTAVMRVRAAPVTRAWCTPRSRQKCAHVSTRRLRSVAGRRSGAMRTPEQ